MPHKDNKQINGIYIPNSYKFSIVMNFTSGWSYVILTLRRPFGIHQIL